MPTGYTAELMDKGQDFRTFVLRCARAFWACVMQRDDPMTDEPKQVEPSAYYGKSLAEAQAALATLQAMGPDARRHHGIGLRADAIARHREWLATERVENARLSAMQDQVLAWTPPSEEHEGLKSFMLEQIKVSLHDTKYVENEIAKAEAQSPEHFYAEAVKSAEWQLYYAHKHIAEELERVGNRNRWIEQLYGSLPS